MLDKRAVIRSELDEARSCAKKRKAFWQAMSGVRKVQEKADRIVESARKEARQKLPKAETRLVTVARRLAAAEEQIPSADQARNALCATRQSRWLYRRLAA